MKQTSKCRFKSQNQPTKTPTSKQPKQSTNKAYFGNTNNTNHDATEVCHDQTYEATRSKHKATKTAVQSNKHQASSRLIRPQVIQSHKPQATKQESKFTKHARMNTKSTASKTTLQTDPRHERIMKPNPRHERIMKTNPQTNPRHERIMKTNQQTHIRLQSMPVVVWQNGFFFTKHRAFFKTLHHSQS